MALAHALSHANKLHLVLASGSPRRVEMLRNLGLVVSVIPSKFEENLDKKTLAPAQYVMQTSKQKALEVFRRKHERRPDVIISADTVVVLDDQILEKPTSKEDAVRMLRSLAGRTHRVMTGVTLVYPVPVSGGAEAKATNVADEVEAGTLVETFHEETEVEFGQLSLEVIEAYVATGEPMDKAGGYGIQGLAASFVKRVNGCYSNVVGFPLHAFCTRFAEIVKGVPEPQKPAQE